MGYSKIEQIAVQIAQPIAEKNGCYLYDVEFVKEGGMYFLRIFVDKEEQPISLDECEVISRAFSEEIDKTDPIQQNYYLEVCSPGIERKLRTEEHFRRYLGEMVDIGFYKAVQGAKMMTAVLKDYQNGQLMVENEQGTFVFEQRETTYVKLHFDF